MAEFARFTPIYLTKILLVTQFLEEPFEMPSFCQPLGNGIALCLVRVGVLFRPGWMRQLGYTSNYFLTDLKQFLKINVLD